jgi:uncharacterized protein YeaO (DUF488 family)
LSHNRWLCQEQFHLSQILFINEPLNLNAALNQLKIKIERIYDNPEGDNGFRILVDRLWPRGLSKERAKIDLWQKDIAPSDSLRKWFAHDENKWNEFRRKYFRELDKNTEAVNRLVKQAKGRDSITLLYGTKERRFNNAAALKEYLQDKVKSD